MKLLAIKTGRSIWLFKTEELNPRGALKLGALDALRARYSFQGLPTAEQFLAFANKSESISYSAGSYDWSKGTCTVLLHIHQDGLVVDTRAGTEAADEFLNDLISWAHTEFKTVALKALPVKRAYLSELSISMPDSLSFMHPKLAKFGKNLSAAMGSSSAEASFDMTKFTFASDPLSNLKQAGFRFEREDGAPFGEGRFYSMAPLQTEVHIKMLEQLEKALAT
jgi:hypothetical protein